MAEKDNFKVDMTLELEGFLLEYVYKEDKVFVLVSDLGLGGYKKVKVGPVLYLKELATRHIVLNDRIKQIDIQPDGKVLDRITVDYKKNMKKVNYIATELKVKFRTSLPISFYGKLAR